VSKTKTELAVSVLEELQVRIGEEAVEADDQAVVLRKIEEVMPEVERKGVITGWRSDAIEEIFMDPLAKLIAARVCGKFVSQGEEARYEAKEDGAWNKLSALSSEPYKARPTRASHI
jgi:hypothetical protein